MILSRLLHRLTTLAQVVPPRPQQQRDPNHHHTQNQTVPLHVQHPSGHTSDVNSIRIRRKTAVNDTRKSFYSSCARHAGTIGRPSAGGPLLASTWLGTM